ncbi:MAG: helix-turn-helix transcriptional regulator [Bacteroidales bacterium]|nr:helix-turn-helix transcriptional regulator [Bacteroidales bacterium]
MNRKEIINATFPDCPVRNVISRVTDKWSLLVLYTLEQNKVLRFKDLRRQIPDISQKMLLIVSANNCENGGNYHTPPHIPNTSWKNSTVLAMTCGRWRVMVWFSPSMTFRVAAGPYVCR